MRLLTLLALVTACGGHEPPNEPSTGSTPSTTPTEPAGPVEDATARRHREHGSILDVSWTQPVGAQAWVEYRFEGDTWLTSPARRVEPGETSALLLGIPYDTDVAFRVVYDAGDGPVTGPEGSKKTARQPAGVPYAQVLVADETGWDADHPYVFTSVTALGGASPTWAFILDRMGRIVWARQAETGTAHMHSHVAADGKALLIDVNTFWAVFDGGRGSRIERVRLDGTVEQVWQTPGLHHPFEELPDGSIAYGAFENGWYGDETLDIVHPDGSHEVVWSCKEWLQSQGLEHDCGSNTLRYDPATDTFLFSFYTFESVVEVGMDGSSPRWFGNVPASYDFDPPESRFFYQHGMHWTDDRTLLVSTYDRDEPTELVVREYEVDDQERTLTEVWSFGVGEGVLGTQMGEAHLLPNGNVHHNYGELARIREARPDGTVVWDLKFPAISYLGRSTPIRDLYALVPGD